ncbi:MAG: hypothetical protein KDD69_19155, partial [Bdellovibrionales bacterium]|nr:hypothetical protein [Bdellovibrionales bacterium]
SPSVLLAKHSLATLKPIPPTAQTRTAATDNVHRERLIDTPDVSGVWEWRMTGNANAPDGYLFIAKTSNGLIKGHALSELALSDGSTPARSVAKFFSFTGEIQLTAERQVLLTFSIPVGGGAQAKSTAILSSDGMSLLQGQTTAERPAGTSVRTLTYQWSASRSRRAFRP